MWLLSGCPLLQGGKRIQLAACHQISRCTTSFHISAPSTHMYTPNIIKSYKKKNRRVNVVGRVVSIDSCLLNDEEKENTTVIFQSNSQILLDKNFKHSLVWQQNYQNRSRLYFLGGILPSLVIYGSYFFTMGYLSTILLPQGLVFL